ncbi:MAG TPA: hypothetical protein EYG54_10205, partial [Myxococcales bacterium]|nr:hypothetical protein [Myxococcales bacterium]
MIRSWILAPRARPGGMKSMPARGSIREPFRHESNGSLSCSLDELPRRSARNERPQFIGRVLKMSSAETGDGASQQALSFFKERFGVDEGSLEATLATALERRIDYADVYLEYTTQDSVSLEEGIVKDGSRHLDQGVGVRAQSGERQGYAHSDEISVDSARLAAGTARTISDQGGGALPVALQGGRPQANLYPTENSPTEVPIESKVNLLDKIDRYARALDPCVKQVMASVITQHRQILVASSDGTMAADTQPLVRLNVQVIAADGDKREIGYEGMGGRYALERLMDPENWQYLAREAVRVAKLNLASVPCPAGSMNVVLGPGW